jgi:hypothetical protein
VILDESIRIQVQHGLGRAETAVTPRPATAPASVPTVARTPKVSQAKGRMNSRKRTTKVVSE